MDWIYCCFFAFYPNRRMFILSAANRVFFMASVIQWTDIIKDKTFYFIVVSKLIWYLERIYSKISSITSSALSLIIISLLLHFESIKNYLSVSLEDITLIANIKWIFYASDFLRLFISFRYRLISLRSSLIDSFFSIITFSIFNIIVATKFTDPYWLLLIFFLFLI